MRAVLYTETNFFELGFSAKNALLKCLTPDSDGKYDTVFVLTKEIMKGIEKLTDEDFGMDWQKEYSYIEKFRKGLADVEVGSKLLMTSQWAGKKELMKAVELLNKGHSLSEINIMFKKEEGIK